MKHFLVTGGAKQIHEIHHEIAKELKEMGQESYDLPIEEQIKNVLHGDHGHIFFDRNSQGCLVIRTLNAIKNSGEKLKIASFGYDNAETGRGLEIISLLVGDNFICYQKRVTGLLV